MVQSRYSEKSASAGGLARTMIAVNLAITLAVFVTWQSHAEALADPMSVMAGSGGSFTPNAFEYPYFLLWVTPLAGATGAYVAIAMQQRAISLFIAFFPSGLTVASAAWLFFQGDYWH